MNKITFFISIIALQVLMTIPSHARLKATVSYSQLVAKSDMVVMIEPIKSEVTGDPYPGQLYGFAQKNFVATSTTFRVHAYLKGGDASVEEITILHFHYSELVGGMANGASFITFVTGSLQDEKRGLIGDKPIGEVSVYKQQPVWLAFLKKRSDGRYDPISNPYHSADSFRRIQE